MNRYRWRGLELGVVLIACLGHWLCADTVLAQEGTSPRRIGVISVGFPVESSEGQAFRQGLKDAGYTEGRDLVIEWRFGGGDYTRVPAMAAELVQMKVDVIVVATTVAAHAASRATSTIPIVMAVVADPIGSGLVNSLAHPDGNVTGLSNVASEISAKRLQLLKRAIPGLNRVAILSNPDVPWHAKVIEDLKAAAPSLSIQLSVARVRSPDEFASAFSDVRRSRAQALYLLDDGRFTFHRKTLVELASKARLPTMYGVRQFVDAGGLMSYGTDTRDLYRRAAGYDRQRTWHQRPGIHPAERG